MKQKPITDGMTDEQKREYAKYVREQQRGNVDNPWTAMPYVNSGISRHIPKKPMSDDLGDGQYALGEQVRRREEREILAARQNKLQLIAKWQMSIEKLTAQIEKIKSDATLSTADKQRKIARRLEIIEHYKNNIAQAQEFIEYQNTKARKIYDKYMKAK